MDRRIEDERINHIESLIKEIHQRQQEITIPSIQRIEHTVFGNGKPGLCTRMTIMETMVKVMTWVVGTTIPLLAIATSWIIFFNK